MSSFNQWQYKGKPAEQQMEIFAGKSFYTYLFIFPNGRYYIGKSSLNSDKSLKKKYFAFGNDQVRNYIKKNGRKNVKRIILMTFATENEAYNAEKYLIRITNAETHKNKGEKDKKYMNISPGGKGVGSGENHPMFGKKHTEESKRKISEKSIGRKPALGMKHSEKTKKKIGDMSRGEKSGMNKYHGKFLYPLVDYNEYIEKGANGRKRVRLFQCLQIIIDNKKIKFDDYKFKCKQKGMRNDQLSGAMHMLINRKQVEIRND